MRERFAVPARIAPEVASSAIGKVPGIALAWFDGKRKGLVSSGFARRDRPVVDTTIFEAASLSKPAFALGVLALSERGLLPLDRPISETVHLRDETDDARVLAITPRHALSHTSGLPNWRFHDEPLRCTFTPGAKFSYSGEGIFLLQRAVEHVSGVGLAAFMHANVFEPLGMMSSSFAYDHRLQQRLVAPHDVFGKPTEHRTALLGEQLLDFALKHKRPLERWTWPEMRAILPMLDPPQRPLPVFSLINAASSLLTTAEDYTMVMRAVTLDHKLTSPQIAVEREISWGLGVGLETRRRLAFHWGDNDGFKAMMACVPGMRRGVVVLTNGDAGIPVDIANLRAFFGNTHPSFAYVTKMYR